MVGYDISEAMIAVGNRILRDAGLDDTVHLRAGDMTSFFATLPGRALCICLASDQRMRFGPKATRREITRPAQERSPAMTHRPPTPDPPGNVLVSACLLGQAVRYDGGSKPCPSPLLSRWLAEGRLVPFCPEMAGGLGVPRPPAECIGGDGEAVRRGEARILDVHGKDVTAAFRAGAEAALALCHKEGVRLAVLKEDSPSCGSARICDGSFSGTTRAGAGLTTAVLRAEGIQVLSEEDLS